MIHEVYNKIRETLPNQHGWCSLFKGFTLTSLVFSIHPDVVVEVGTFAGRSAFPMALAMRELGKGKLIAIDAWNASVSAGEETGDSKAWWSNVNHEVILQDFRRGIQEMGLQDIVQVIKSKSDDVEPVPCQILHIDGAHSLQALTDCKRFSPLVSTGGFLILDDVNWQLKGPAKALEHALSIGFKELYRVEGLEKETNMTNDWCVMQRL